MPVGKAVKRTDATDTMDTLTETAFCDIMKLQSETYIHEVGR
jgi:hypothetical protein